jgi:hypothetical protein
VYVSLYALTLAVFLAVFYGGSTFYSEVPTSWTFGRVVAYCVMGRPTWSLCLAVLCIMWFATPADPIAQLLSWPVWCGDVCIL